MISPKALEERAKFYASLVNSDVATAYLSVPRKHVEPLEESLTAAINWICAAQDAGGDGGVARSYSAVYNRFFGKRGWTRSYPETTGYIIPTMFDYARQTGREDLIHRAIRMTDWECDVQMPNGAVQGGTIDAPPTPAIFNTGQVIFGWVRAYQETGNPRYLNSARRAGDFLVSAQDTDGAWRKDLSHYASTTMPSFTYNTRTAWGLFVLAEAIAHDGYRQAATRNIEFALGEQLPNGWFRHNCLNDSSRPLLHTIAYSLRGIVEIGIASKNERYISAVRKAADVLLDRQRPDGSLAGRFDDRWTPAVGWSCLTGNAQMGTVWARLYHVTGDQHYAAGLAAANRFLQTVQWKGTGNAGLDGGISGSHPFHGEYGRFEVLNWATKFFADSLMFQSSLQPTLTP
jgi:uncharacterized protein YyaL (SSP411 family)